MRIEGKVVKWNDDRGFGFIEAATGGPLVFVHISEFKDRGGKPQIGESLSFEIASDDAGRKKAVAIERKTRRQTRANPLQDEEKTSLVGVLFICLILVVVGALGYDYFQRRLPEATVVTVEEDVGRATVVAQSVDGRFRCDGRQHCSQMRSCDEARFFLSHCPDTKMDGDGDGEPCESTLCTTFLSR